jgi:hypothetical protein
MVGSVRRLSLYATTSRGAIALLTAGITFSAISFSAISSRERRARRSSCQSWPASRRVPKSPT